MRICHILCFLSLFLVFSCNKKSTEAPSFPPVDVTEFVVKPTTIPVTFDYVGFAESSHPVEIRAKVEGYLQKIAYQEGHLVQEGDLLFQLDPTQYQARVRDAKSEVERQRAILENAVLTVKRLTPLYEQNATSKKDLDNAISNQAAAQASFDSSKARLADAEINLGYTTIHSPITGFADQSKYREGALISPGSQGLLTTVSVFDPIWVSFTVSDNDILRISQQLAEKTITLPGESEATQSPKEQEWQAEAILSDGTTFPYKGRVTFRTPTYDKSTGTLQDRATFPNPKGELRPGQFVKIKVYGAHRPNAILVPRRSLLQKANGMFVYLINAENKVIAQDVETGDWFGNYQIITNGLKADDRIIADGINKVHAGMLVNVIASSDHLKETAK